MRDLEQLWRIVRQIPYGRCASYGDVARELDNPVSGYTVGRWMANAPAGTPWWRVVTKHGDLAIAKRDPAMAIEQRHLLEGEGVVFVDGRVQMGAFRHDFDAPPSGDGEGRDSGARRWVKDIT